MLTSVPPNHAKMEVNVSTLLEVTSATAKVAGSLGSIVMKVKMYLLNYL